MCGSTSGICLSLEVEKQEKEYIVYRIKPLHLPGFAPLISSRQVTKAMIIMSTNLKLSYP